MTTLDTSNFLQRLSLLLKYSAIIKYAIKAYTFNHTSIDDRAEGRHQLNKSDRNCEY